MTSVLLVPGEVPILTQLSLESVVPDSQYIARYVYVYIHPHMFICIYVCICMYV